MLEDTIILWDNKTILATLTFKKKSEEEIAIHKFLAQEGTGGILLLNFFVLMLRTFKDIIVKSFDKLFLHRFINSFPISSKNKSRDIKVVKSVKI